MLCLLRRHVIASKFDYFVIHENARAERVQTSSTVRHNANYVKMFFINFIRAEHVSKFVFELISVEIAFV